MDTREESIRKLRERGLRPSEQRIAVYSYLLENRIHPCAEGIYQALSPQYPTLSRTTVYNTLKSFEESGLVMRLTIEDGEVRYDVNTIFHAHFKCEHCKSVTDFFPAGFEEKIPHPGNGYEVSQIRLDFYGTCPACSERKAE